MAACPSMGHAGLYVAPVLSADPITPVRGLKCMFAYLYNSCSVGLLAVLDVWQGL